MEKLKKKLFIRVLARGETLTKMIIAKFGDARRRFSSGTADLMFHVIERQVNHGIVRWRQPCWTEIWTTIRMKINKVLTDHSVNRDIVGWGQDTEGPLDVTRSQQVSRKCCRRRRSDWMLRWGERASITAICEHRPIISGDILVYLRW
jgi:hypothetical protein